jgi:hypothetical protein
MTVFWNVATCSLVEVNQLVNYYQTTRRYNPEYIRRENLKSYVLESVNNVFRLTKIDLSLVYEAADVTSELCVCNRLSLYQLVRIAM